MQRTGGAMDSIAFASGRLPPTQDQIEKQAYTTTTTLNANHCSQFKMNSLISREYEVGKAILRARLVALQGIADATGADIMLFYRRRLP